MAGFNSSKFSEEELRPYWQQLFERFPDCFKNRDDGFNKVLFYNMKPWSDDNAWLLKEVGRLLEVLKDNKWAVKVFSEFKGSLERRVKAFALCAQFGK